MSASYTKLRSGDWGVRIVGSAKKGDKISVTKKDGTSQEVVIEKIVWSGNGVTLAAIKQREPQSSRRGGGDGQGRCWECGGAMDSDAAERGEECGYC